MSGAIWLNGEFVERESASVSAFDAAFQHGVGLFETMLAVEGRVFRLFDHLDRLAVSARALGLTESLRMNPLGEVVQRTVDRAALDRARVRLTVSGGDLNLLSSTGRGPLDPTILVHAQPATPYPPEMFERGVRVVVADLRLNPFDPFQGHKTINYWPRLRELQAAAAKGAGEAVFLQVSNHLAGGAVSNLFLVRDGRLLTPIARGEEATEGPALRSPVLPGVTRRVVIELAEAEGLDVERRMLSINDLLGADEAFLTNSQWGVLPIVGVEAAPLGPGRPGPLTLDLRTKWTDAVHEEQSDL